MTTGTLIMAAHLIGYLVGYCVGKDGQYAKRIYN